MNKSIKYVETEVFSFAIKRVHREPSGEKAPSTAVLVQRAQGCKPMNQNSSLLLNDYFYSVYLTLFFLFKNHTLLVILRYKPGENPTL